MLNEPINGQISRIKFRIEGAFCANCAAKMEKALSSTDIGETTINFATKTVYLPPAAQEIAQSIMEKIEPGIKLVAVGRQKESSKESETNTSLARLRIIRMVIAGILLAFGLIFTPKFLNTSFAPIEYFVYLTAYLLVGYEVLIQAIRNIFRGAVFDENFLMSLATVGAIAIHELPEAVGVMLFYAVGEYIQDLAVNHSRRSIQALLAVKPDYANLIYQLNVLKVDPEDVQVGQEILVKPGEKIPLDGEVLNGASFVDTSALTGESVPRQVEKGNSVLAGTINQSGVLNIRVTRPFAESSMQKILDLVENANTRKARTEKFITTFSRYYTPGVVVVALAIALLPPLMLGGSLSTWVYRALTILVISCPCALVISVPLGYFGGIGGASRHGILVKGANYLEALTKVETVVFDKTGTLTEGVFEVIKIQPGVGFSEENLLKLTALAETHSNHPIAKSILKKYGEKPDIKNIAQYEEINGKGIRAFVYGQELLAGKADFLQESGISIPLSDNEIGTGTKIHVAVADRYAGYLLIADRIKAGAKETIEKLHHAGIKTIMFTGDQAPVARAVADVLGVSEHYADLLPEDKVALLEKLMTEPARRNKKVVFVGDGINDAPVLTRADIGVAMGGLGSDAAIEASDVVLMDDKPQKLLTSLNIARFTKKIIWQNIVFALLIKLGFIILGIFGLANMWEAVFGDTGVALLAILNAARVRLQSVQN